MGRCHRTPGKMMSGTADSFHTKGVRRVRDPRVRAREATAVRRADHVAKAREARRASLASRPRRRRRRRRRRHAGGSSLGSRRARIRVPTSATAPDTSTRRMASTFSAGGPGGIVSLSALARGLNATPSLPMGRHDATADQPPRARRRRPRRRSIATITKTTRNARYASRIARSRSGRIRRSARRSAGRRATGRSRGARRLAVSSASPSKRTVGGATRCGRPPGVRGELRCGVDVPPDLKSQVVTGASAQKTARQGKHFSSPDRRKLGCAHNLDGPARPRGTVCVCRCVSSTLRSVFVCGTDR
mmetsp:Transcript_21213/g.53986  ORF Transcript_21213/g.53986 Transcript_21213/m.53986 type:complete len:303 (+) Transcript_21213:127-1035(+)